MIEYLLNIARINLTQREEEGVDIAPFKKRYEKLVANCTMSQAGEVLALIEELERHPIADDFGYYEPCQLPSIQQYWMADSPAGSGTLSESRLRDAILGGWLGRTAGCRLGRPIEGTPYGHRKEDVRRYLDEGGQWPIRDYVYPDKLAEPIDPSATRPFRGMIRDDDIDYVILNLLILEQFGREWTHANAREMWLRHLSHDFVYAAGRAAYASFCLGLQPPQTATWGNPCRQSLGAMIRCDTWGWACPGDPAQAAALAYRDAIISQTANGIYSGMFFAAIIAAAFVEDNIEKLIEIGLGYIPPKSRLAGALRFTSDCWKSGRNWETAIDNIYARYSGQYFNAAIINACIVELALLSGDGDFERTIINAVIAGFDTDCNGATAGSICGVILGASRLPEKWTAPLCDTYETYLAGLGVQRLSNLAERTAAVALNQT